MRHAELGHTYTKCDGRKDLSMPCSIMIASVDVEELLAL